MTASSLDHPKTFFHPVHRIEIRWTGCFASWRLTFVIDEQEGLQAYYALGTERDRLVADGIGRLEFLRTIEVIGRTLPPVPAAVADIGGGPGRYTDWLVGLGHRVAHRDVVGSHVEQVLARHEGIDSAVDAAIGDARSLDLDDRSFDAVLLLGPIYHLSDRGDRLAALREATRVVKPGGPVHVAAISRWAARLHGVLMARVHHDDPEVLDVLAEVEASGHMPPRRLGHFGGYTHRPDELAAEIVEAGLELESLVSVEGAAYSFGDLDQRLADDAEREVLLDSLRAVEAVPELLGVGPHMLVSARRPG